MRRGLLAGAGDQEDVVVHAERYQEQEREERGRDVERLEACGRDFGIEPEWDR